MGWQAKIRRWHEDEAEIRVDVDFLDSAGDHAADELIVLPTGTPEARVLEEIGRRARAARSRVSRDHTGENPNVGKMFAVDDL